MSGVVHEVALAPGLMRWVLDHPAKRNALTPEMLAELARRADALRGEVVLLEAAAGPCFCAGFDVDAIPELPQDQAPDAPLIDASRALQRADAITIAVLGGDVFGAGVELAAACDLRIAAPGIRFIVPAARLGVVYHARGIQLLRAVFGPALARRLLLAADEVRAEEALRAGALASLHEPGELPAAALTLADRLLRGAPRCRSAHRDLLRALDRGPLTPEAEAAHELARREAFGSSDFREGVGAARSRRAPRFSPG